MANSATTKKSTSTSSSDTTTTVVAEVNDFTVFTKPPAARRGKGREASPLRKKIASLKVGEYMDTGISIAKLPKEDADKLIANVRTKATGVRNTNKSLHFSVFVTEGDESIPDGHIIVGRNEDSPQEVPASE